MSLKPDERWIPGLFLVLALAACSGVVDPAPDAGPDAPLSDEGMTGDTSDTDPGTDPDANRDAADDARPADTGPEDPAAPEVPDVLPCDPGSLDPVAPRVPAGFDPYGGITDLPVPNDSGFFRTALLDNRWVLSTPAGHAFVSLGVNHINMDGDHCPATGYSPYRLNNRAQWGTDAGDRARFFAHALDLLREQGFNTVSAWSAELQDLMNRRELDPMPYAVVLNIQGGVTNESANPRIDNIGDARMPDVFDPGFGDSVRDYIARAVPVGMIADPYLIGYFTDNELAWWGDPIGGAGKELGLVQKVLALPRGTPARDAFTAFALAAYDGELGALNAAWGTSFADADDLAEVADLPGDAAFPARTADQHRFLEHLARTYFDVVNRNLKAVDPNHLNLCAKFASGVPMAVPAGAQACDVLTINDYYTTWPGAEERWKETALLAGGGAIPKPAFLSEFSRKALDSNIPGMFGAGPSVATQMDRAAYYRDTIDWGLDLEAGGIRFVAGFHWFQWADQPKLGRFDVENSNYGLSAVDGSHYQVLLHGMKAQHRDVLDRLLGGEATVLETPDLFPPVPAREGHSATRLAWCPVAGASSYRVLLSPVPWFPRMPRAETWGGEPVTGPADGAYVVGEPPFRTPSNLPAGTWYATVAAEAPDLAIGSDFATRVSWIQERNCPDTPGTGLEDLMGCFDLPPPADNVGTDGWAMADLVHRGEGAGEPWARLTFVPSSIGMNHPSMSGQGLELAVTFEPPVPLAGGATHRFCTGRIPMPDGSLEPASRFLQVRLTGTGGDVLWDGRLSDLHDVAAGDCSPPLRVGDTPVARVEYFLHTAEPGIVLDLPFQILVQPIR